MPGTLGYHHWRMRMSILESKIQKDVCSYGRINGWYVRKFSSPGRKNVPDTLWIKAKEIFFIEFKRYGEKPRKGQIHEFKKIEKQGIPVHIIDSYIEGKRLVNRENVRLSKIRGKSAS